MSVIISLSNQKGGVAKTTTCANLGAGLAMRGYKTLLVDFDPQANLTQFLKPKGPLSFYVDDWIASQATADQVIQETSFPKLYMAPSSELLKAEEIKMQNDGIKGLKYLEKKLNAVRDRFDFILIDTLPSFSHLFMASLVAGDQVLIPAKLEFLSMQGIQPLLSKIQEIREEMKPLGLLGVVGTFYRNGVRESEKSMDEFRTALPDRMFSTAIRLNAALAESAAHGTPIQHYDPRSPGSEDYEKLVEEVLERCQSKVSAEAPLLS